MLTHRLAESEPLRFFRVSLIDCLDDVNAHDIHMQSELIFATILTELLLQNDCVKAC